MLPPGSTIGILGGGQLGRMLAVAAAQLGYQVHIYAPDRESVASDVAAHHVQAAWDDEPRLAAFAAACDVITYEFENVPVDTVRFLSGHVAIRPDAELVRALTIHQVQEAVDRCHSLQRETREGAISSRRGGQSRRGTLDAVRHPPDPW